MKRNCGYLACLALAGLTLPGPADAVPERARPAAQAAATAAIPFDPPLGEPLFYRTAKTVQKDGKSRMTWSTSSYVFAETDDGYAVTITPLDQGSSEDSPLVKSIEKKLADLTGKPYTVLVSDEGVVTGMAEEAMYWTRIFDAMEAAIKEPGVGTAPVTPETAAALAKMLKLFRDMPASTRLGLLTEDVQPLVEFAATETTMGKPINASVASASPFGGTISRDMSVDLAAVDADTATLTVYSSVPRAEVEAVLRKLVADFASPANAAATKTMGAAKLDAFAHETRARYRVALDTGLLQDFESLETVTAESGADKTRKVTSWTIKRVSR